MKASITFQNHTLSCEGQWNKDTISSLFHQYESYKSKILSIDLSNITELDTAGAMFILKIQKNSNSAKLITNNPKIEQIINLCKEHQTLLPQKPKKPFFISEFFFWIGKTMDSSLKTLLSFLSFIGGTTQTLLATFLNPAKWRLSATLYHIEKNGLHALPIVALTSLLIGMVIAYQGAVQLEKFGANIFIVEMVGISATRELAPLLVAIVIAGRSASSYTAQLGVMKITEEVDAMRTLGFSEWEFLVLPRVIALIISLPLLVIFADGVSIFGGMLVANGELDVTFFEFINRFQETVALKHILIGLLKAPFFGWIIATVGCFRGFQITSSTESVGKYTTVSVVNAIFWVIAFDAIASIFLTQVGL